MSDTLAQSRDRILGFNPEQLARRYREERDRRVRHDAEAQFVEVDNASVFAGKLLVNDPYAERIERAAIEADQEAVVIGGGWVGMHMAARLKQAGIADVQIIDSASDFGGTWYWNRYPGAQCDTESYIYLPLLEETGYVPKLRYCYAPEIFAHARRIGRHFGLYENALFQTWVTDLTWDEKAGRWLVSTNRGDRIRARYVCLGTGAANRPRLPGIPGIADFKGHFFHTCRWDYDYTGGDHGGRLDKLADKTMAVIGTGATAAQCIPALGASAKQLYVFQRTPSSVDCRTNAATDTEWLASLKPGWQEELQREFDEIVTGARPCSDRLQEDGWMRMARNFAFVKQQMGNSDAPENLAELAQLADYRTMEQIRRRVDETVVDPAIAGKLKAYYNQFCKRPVFNDEYLPTFNRPNVELIDASASRGVERISERGVVVDGKEYAVDCIVYASGFEITSSYRRRIGIPIQGVGGRSIYDHWANGMRAMHGLIAHGFPNLFLCGGLFVFQLGVNYCSGVDIQARHIADTIAELEARGVRVVDATTAGEEAWIEQQLSGTPTLFAQALGGAPASCTPGYYNQEGTSRRYRSNLLETFGAGLDPYRQTLAEWRSAGILAGLELKS